MTPAAVAALEQGHAHHRGQLEVHHRERVLERLVVERVRDDERLPRLDHVGQDRIGQLADGVGDGLAPQVARRLDHRLARLHQDQEPLVGVGDLDHDVEQLIDQGGQLVALHQLAAELVELLVGGELGGLAARGLVGAGLIVERELQLHRPDPDPIVVSQLLLGALAPVDEDLGVAIGGGQVELAAVEVDVGRAVRQRRIGERHVGLLATPQRGELLVDPVHLGPLARKLNLECRHGASFQKRKAAESPCGVRPTCKAGGCGATGSVINTSRW